MILLILPAFVIAGLVYLMMRQRRYKQKVKPSDSGVYANYSLLIDGFLQQYKTARIDGLRVNSLSIRTSKSANAPVFSLTTVQDRIVIVWTWTNSGLGRRGKEWSFPDYYDQTKMLEEIKDDVTTYQIEVYQKSRERPTMRVACV